MLRSPTAQLWQYPLSSPSPRFTRMNTFVRQLGWRYSALSPTAKSGWDSAGSMFPWLGYCLPEIWDVPDTGYATTTGLQVYNTVNCARLDNGLTVTDSAPTSAVGLDSDLAYLTEEPDGTYLTWSGRPTDPTGTFYADIRIWIGNNLPGFGPAVTKFTYEFSLPILYNTPVLLFPVEVPPPPPSGQIELVGVTIGDYDAGPFFGERLAF